MKALKLDDEKGYMNKNVEGDSNDQGQPKRNTRERIEFYISLERSSWKYPEF